VNEHRPDLLGSLGFYISKPHDCSYLPDQQAVTLFANPDSNVDTLQYSLLAHYGFRRSGSLFYRPRCPACEACTPIRVLVNRFQPRRGQRRIWNRNTDLKITACPGEFSQEHFSLYKRYIGSRHSGGGMDTHDDDKYREFLFCPDIDTIMYEARLADRLLAVAVVDRLSDALSSVYTFFDPAEARRSLGVFTILWTIAEARRLGRRWVYLGYWIQETRKMAYKDQYRPFEKLEGGKWIEISD